MLERDTSPSKASEGEAHPDSRAQGEKCSTGDSGENAGHSEDWERERFRVEVRDAADEAGDQLYWRARKAGIYGARLEEYFREVGSCLSAWNHEMEELEEPK